jgi:DNA (cytosine-5)-methyltransferase 1
MSMRTLDLFAGGGGSSYGAKAAGVQLAGAIDMWDVATATYHDNFPDAHVKTGKIENIKPGLLQDKIGDIDLLISSPECTNHTCAKGSRPISEESRATAFQVVRYARFFKPRWIIIENVIYMRTWPRYHELKLELEKLGYKLREQILNAAHFGVPQKRRRLFITAELEAEPNEIVAPNLTEFKTVNDILDPPGSWKVQPLDKLGRATATLERAKRAFEVLGKSASFLIVYYGSDGSGGWQKLDEPLRTITTVDRFGLVEPSSTGPTLRMLQVSELMRATGFEDDYVMNVGDRRKKIKLLGNAVCPPVMREVVRGLTKCDSSRPQETKHG